MKKIIALFLLCMVGYHVFHTFLVYGIELLPGTELAVLRDIVRFFMLASIAWLARKEIGSFVSQWKRPLVLLVLLLLWSVGLSVSQGVGLSMIVVGLKYDVWPLVILMSGVFIGWVSRSTDNFSLFGDTLPISHWFGVNVEADSFSGNQGGVTPLSGGTIRWFMILCIVILVGGLVWQVAKLVIPDFFSWWGYGPVGDYVLGVEPPMYYRTGPGGVMRLQGLFAGPNNYGFFLVSFASVVLYGVFSCLRKPPASSSLRSDLSTPLSGGTNVLFVIALFVLYVVSLGWTLSRGAWIGVGVQIFLLVWLFQPAWKKYLGWLVVGGILALLAVAGLKGGSTMAHFWAWFEGRDAFLANPWGYGLASAGPGVHREGVYLPENHYLQILLDIGVPGLLLWLGVLGSLFWQHIGYRSSVISHQSRENISQKDILLLLLVLGLVGLLVEGLFLHVFEDSMVNYLFLVPLGIVLGKNSKDSTQ